MRGVLITVVAILIGQAYCQEGGQVNNIYFNYTGYDAQESNIYFQLGVSINGQTGDVCASGVTNKTANDLCEAILGSIGISAEYLIISGVIAYPNNTADELYDFSYTNFSCPNVSSCNGTQVSNCTGNGGLLGIRCNYACYPESLYLSNAVNTSNGPGLYALTGRPTICNAGKFVPICDTVSLSPLNIRRICAYSEGLLSGFVGTPGGVMVPPLDLGRIITSVVTGFECSSITDCTNTTTMGTCSNDYATVTCQKVCNDGDDDSNHNFELFNQYTSSDGSNTYIAGIPQFCADGAISRVCNDGTNSPRIAHSGCRSLGYKYGQLLPYNATVYNGTPPNVVYYSNFSCNASGDCGDNAYFSTDSRCYEGQLEYFFRCYNESQSCNASGVSFFANFSRVSSGQQLVSGIAVMCINGWLVPLCDEDDDFDSDDIDLVCTSMGYDGGMMRPSDPSRYGPGPQGVGYYSNFSCPLNATDTSGCTATRTNNSVCTGGNKDLVIECYLGQPTTMTRTTTASVTRTATVTTVATTAPATVTATTATPTTSSTPTTKSSSNVGLAVGVTIAVLVVVAIIVAIVVVVVFIVIRKRRSGSLDF